MLSGATQHSIDRLTMDLPKCIKDDMVHHNKLNTLAGLRKLIQAINAWYWEWKGELSHETWASDLLETSLNTSLTTSPAKVLQIPRQKQQQLWLYPGQGLLFWTEEVHHSQPFFETWERRKANSTGTSVPSWQQVLPSFVAPLEHVTKDCPKIQLGFHQSLSVQVWSGQICVFWHRFEKTEQSLNSAQPEDCIELPHAKTLTLNASALSNPDSLTLFLTSNTLPDMVLKSLWIPDLPTLSLILVFVSDSASSSIWNSTYQTPTPRWNFNSVISQALDLQICFPTGNPESDFLRHSMDQSCMIVLGYCWLTHYNPSIDWVLGSIFFWQLSQHESKSHPLSRHFCHWHPFRNFWTLSWIFQNQFCW